MTNETSLDELIVGYSAGRLPAAVGFLVANHIELSPSSARLASLCDHIGGSLISDLDESRCRPSLLGDVFSSIDGEPERCNDVDELKGDADLPLSLRRYLKRSIDQLEWREFSGIGEHELTSCDSEGYSTKLINVRAGRAVPQHTHDGDELTLILRGAFEDVTGRYERGDLAIADHDIDHRPVADSSEDCLCLAVTNAPIRLSGTFSKFLNPFLRF